MTANSVRPRFDDLGLAVAPLVASDGDQWGAIVFTDDNGCDLKFTVYHRYVVDFPQSDTRHDGADVWDITDLSNWKTPYPSHWSHDRCRIRLQAELELSDALAALELRLHVRSDPAGASDFVRQVLRDDTDLKRKSIKERQTA